MLTVLCAVYGGDAAFFCMVVSSAIYGRKAAVLCWSAVLLTAEIYWRLSVVVQWRYLRICIVVCCAISGGDR
eukprot:3638859-Rhodomonas_salina.1